MFLAKLENQCVENILILDSLLDYFNSLLPSLDIATASLKATGLLEF